MITSQAAYTYSYRPRVAFYPTRRTSHYFDSGARVSPDMFVQRLHLEEIDEEYEAWNHITQEGLWGAELYPDFPWIEAMLGIPIEASKEGYRLVFSEDQTSRRAYPSFNPENPWIEGYFRMLKSAAYHAQGRYPLAIPSIKGALSLATVFFGESQIQSWIKTCPDALKKAIDKTIEFIIRFYQNVFSIIQSIEGKYTTGSSFLPFDIPCVVFQETLFPLEWIRNPNPLGEFIDVMKKDLGCAFYLKISAPSLRWIDAVTFFASVDGVIVEKDETGFPWEDMVPLLQGIQEEGKALVIAGYPAMEDWKFLLQNLRYQDLIILFYVATFQEARFWSNYLSENSRRKAQ